MNWSFYRETDGRFLSRHFTSTSPDALKINTPAGCRAIEGAYDHLSQRVDLATGEVVGDGSLSVERDVERAKEAALRRIFELERQQHRRVREVLAAQDQQIKELDEQIESERAKLSGRA